MTTRLLLTLVVCALLAGGAYARKPTAMPQAKPAFTSSYTSLTNCGSGMTKKEERESEQRGTDIPSVCKGPDGYNVDISYSACSSSFSVTKGEENISRRQSYSELWSLQT